MKPETWRSLWRISAAAHGAIVALNVLDHFDLKSFLVCGFFFCYSAIQSECVWPKDAPPMKIIGDDHDAE